METKVTRLTVDLSGYPGLIVILTGMRVNTLSGIKAIFGFASRFGDVFGEWPDGLLAHEPVIFSLRHRGFRQYWRDFESLQRWSRSEPHQSWWSNFLRSSNGTGFWHEIYSMQGGMEGIYLDLPVRVGFKSFAPVMPATEERRTAGQRLRQCLRLRG